MGKWIIVDEFHLTVRIPADLSKTSLIVRTLKSKRFETKLHASISQVVQSHPSLQRVKVTLSR